MMQDWCQTLREVLVYIKWLVFMEIWPLARLVAAEKSSKIGAISPELVDFNQFI
jgi:hypothetical protein